jgi:hypothetical protein
MKITSSQLRSIIKEEVEKEKLRKIIRESVRQELIREGFLDKIKGVFGGGMEKDFAFLKKAISKLPMKMQGVKPNKEHPKYAVDFLAAMVGDGLDVQIPGKKGKGFWLGTLFDGDGNVKEKDLTNKLLDLQQQHKNKKLDDDKFEKEVVKLVGFPRSRWKEFDGFVTDLMAAAKEQEEKAKSESEYNLEQGKKERERIAREKAEEENRVYKPMGKTVADARREEEEERQAKIRTGGPAFKRTFDRYLPRT